MANQSNTTSPLDSTSPLAVHVSCRSVLKNIRNTFFRLLSCSLFLLERRIYQVERRLHSFRQRIDNFWLPRRDLTSFHVWSKRADYES